MQARTLAEALRSAAAGSTGGHVFHLDGGPVELGWQELLERSLRLAAVLDGRGVRRGDAVGIAGPNGPEWIVGACAAWLAGAAVVPVQIPLRLRDAEAFRVQVAALVGAAGCRTVLVAPAYEQAIAEELRLRWDAQGSATHSDDPDPEDVAVIQFTSGSTAAPRGAQLTHRAMLAQMQSLDASGVLFGSGINLVAWTPFFHDLGLVLAIVAPLAFASTAHHLPTARFVRDPAEWFRLIDRTQATFTIGPSSAWAAALRRTRRSDERFDLSTLEFACFGAEGVDPATVDALLAECRPDPARSVDSREHLRARGDRPLRLREPPRRRAVVRRASTPRR